MEYRKYTEYQLDMNSNNIVKDILRMSGWRKNRKVDIKNLEVLYYNNGIRIDKTVKAFFEEYYGLILNWIVYREKTSHKDSIRDYYYDMSVRAIEVILNDEDGDLVKQLPLIKKYEPLGAIPVAESGEHLGGILWLSSSGKFYRTYYYNLDVVECFESFIEVVEHDFNEVMKSEPIELCISFGGYAKEWFVANDFYLKKYEEEYEN